LICFNKHGKKKPKKENKYNEIKIVTKCFKIFEIKIILNNIYVLKVIQ